MKKLLLNLLLVVLSINTVAQFDLSNTGPFDLGFTRKEIGWASKSDTIINDYKGKSPIISVFRNDTCVVEFFQYNPCKSCRTVEKDMWLCRTKSSHINGTNMDIVVLVEIVYLPEYKKPFYKFTLVDVLKIYKRQ